jgi:hypothetical protein
LVMSGLPPVPGQTMAEKLAQINIGPELECILPLEIEQKIRSIVQRAIAAQTDRGQEMIRVL